MSRFVEMQRYYNGVNDIGCFKSVISSEHSNILEKMDWLNAVLPTGCKIVDWYIFHNDESKYDHMEDDIFIEIYKDYRFWVFEKYFDDNFSFAQNHYVRPTTNYNTYRAFFAQTLMSFLREYIYRSDDNKLGMRGRWTEKGVIAHKMLLGALLICDEIKPKDWHIPYGFTMVLKHLNPDSNIDSVIFAMHSDGS